MYRKIASVSISDNKEKKLFLRDKHKIFKYNCRTIVLNYLPSTFSDFIMVNVGFISTAAVMIMYSVCSAGFFPPI